MRLNPHKKTKVADDSWLHCCQYCHHFSQGECLHPKMLVGLSAPAYGEWFSSACEDGLVQETLEEDLMTTQNITTLCEDLVEVLIDDLGYKLSKKRLETFRTKFQETYEDFVRNIVVSMDSSLCTALIHHAPRFNGSGGVEILNPTEQVCNLWE